ncbi:MAG: hypothetical protein ABSA46_10280 [Thermodesulfovibrionales bacterium]
MGQRLLEGLVIGLITTVLSKVIEIGKVDMLSKIYQHFVIELWPIWAGMVAASVYWFIRFQFDLYKFKNRKYETFHHWMKSKDLSGHQYEHMG